MMKQIVMCLILTVFMVGPSLADEVSVEDFEVKTTRDLIDLCTAGPEDPMSREALHFCHGYLVGAYHYYAASVSGPNARQLVCPPEQRPSRNETIKMFVEWAKNRPQYWGELPVETEFRFLTELWPCDR